MSNTRRTPGCLSWPPPRPAMARPLLSGPRPRSLFWGAEGASVCHCLARVLCVALGGSGLRRTVVDFQVPRCNGSCMHPVPTESA